MKILYKPFGLLVGVLGGLVAGRIFGRVWRLVGREGELPEATDAESSLHEVVVVGAMQGAIFGAVKAAIDRAGADGFAFVTGTWPGKKRGGRDTA
jgi:hypothetical protein